MDPSYLSTYVDNECNIDTSISNQAVVDSSNLCEFTADNELLGHENYTPYLDPTDSMEYKSDAYVETVVHSDTESYDSETLLLPAETTEYKTVDHTPTTFIGTGYSGDDSSNLCEFTADNELLGHENYTPYLDPTDSIAYKSDTYVETVVHSDTESYDSESLLLPAETTEYKTVDHTPTTFIGTGYSGDETLPNLTDEACDSPMVYSDNTAPDTAVKEVEPLSYRELTDYVPHMEPIPETGACPILLGHSNASIWDGDITVEEITVTPLNIIGSGWEFGSISSIYRRPIDGFRSRSNTIESKADSLRYKTDFETGNRLLSRVFASKVGFSIDSLRKSSDGIDVKLSAVDYPEQKLPDTESLVAPRCGNIKNIITVSIAGLLLHIAQYGLRNLQSSLNSEGGIGVISMCISAILYIIGSMISPFIIQRFGPKLCLVLGTAAHVFYFGANYHATLLTIVPTSAILGIGSALTWNAISTYITETGIIEAEQKNKRTENVIGRYFGIFFLSLQMGMVIGNLLSSLILVPKPPIEYTLPQNTSTGYESVYNISANLTDYSFMITPTNASNNGSIMTTPISDGVCGIGFCNAVNKGQRIDDQDKLILLGSYGLCGILSVIVLYFCLDYIPNYETRTFTIKEVAAQALAVLSIVTDKDYALVVPMCLYSFWSVGFVIADVLKAYVTCPMGINMVGYTMICYGVCGSVSSFAFGKVVKHTGRIPIFLTAGLLNMTSLALMVIWRPTGDDINYLFVLIGAWGFADGIWQSQINSLISTVFADRYESAFGAFRILQGVAGMIVFSVSSVFCMMTKLYLTAAMCIISLVLYIAMELRRKRTVLVKEIYVNVNS